MKKFATFHISKPKPSSGALHAHIERKHIPDNANAQATPENWHVVEGKPYREEEYQQARSDGKIESIQNRVDKRIEEGYTAKRKIRSNTVKSLNVMLTGSHEPLVELAKDRQKLGLWMKANYDFVASEFSKQNIVDFTVHLDEATPHIHATVVPLTIDGRLSAKELLNGKDRKAPKGKHLRELQDRYAENMAEFGLERGISAKKTQVKHTTTAEYYQGLEAAKKELEPLKRTSLNFKKAKATAVHALGEAKIALEGRENEKTKAIHRAIADIRESANLIGLAQENGYKVERLKSCSSSVQMNNGTEKIVVSKSEKKGHWMYFKMGTEERGNAVDFLRNEGKEWSEILRYSTLSALVNVQKEGRKIEESMPEVIRDLKAAHEEAVSRFENSTSKTPLNTPKINYLTLHRGISHLRVKTPLEGLKIGLNKIEVKTYLPDESKKWLQTGLIAYEGSKPSKKSFAKGLPKGWAIVSAGEREKWTMIFCESPIDGLSYAELKGLKDYSVIASCGRPSKKQMEGLKLLAKDQREAVVLGDNDEAGRGLAEEFRSVLQTEKKTEVKIKFPSKGKDFNEEIQAVKRLKEELKSKSKGKSL